MTEQSEKQAKDSSGRSSAVLAGTRGGVLGLKSGMTQVFDSVGQCIPVTVIDLQPNVVSQVKTRDRDGYCAVQVGVLPKKVQRTTRAEKGHFKKSGAPGFGYLTEFRVDNVDDVKVGAELSLAFLKEGDLVDITSVSKGKGFQGVMKRHNFAGGAGAHGASVCHRSPGSIGNRADPGRVFPGKKMPGHMGFRQVTIQNLKVIGIDLENGLIMVKGSVPGPKRSIVTVRKAVRSAR